MAKRDFYEILGVAKTATDAELKSAFRKLGDAVPSRPQSRRQAGRGALQGAQRGLSASLGRRRSAPPTTASATPPSSRAAGMRRRLRPFARCPTFSTICSATSWAAARRAAVRPRARRRPALQSRNHPRGGLSRARPRRSRMPTSVDLRGLRRLGRASRARSRRPARPAAATAACARSRASSPSSAPARPATAAARHRQSLPDCAGAGRVTRERTLSVNVPRRRRGRHAHPPAGEGEAGMRGGPPGDLYIFLSLKPHPFFQRDGADLFCRVPISMVQAALGGEFAVPHARRRRRQGAHPRGHAVRPAVAAARQGHAGPALARFRRPVHPGGRRDAAEPDAPPARIAAGVRGRIVATRPIRKARASSPR